MFNLMGCRNSSVRNFPHPCQRARKAARCLGSTQGTEKGIDKRSVKLRLYIEHNYKSCGLFSVSVLQQGLQRLLPTWKDAAPRLTPTQLVEKVDPSSNVGPQIPIFSVHPKNTIFYQPLLSAQPTRETLPHSFISLDIVCARPDESVTL